MQRLILNSARLNKSMTTASNLIQFTNCRRCLHLRKQIGVSNYICLACSQKRAAIQIDMDQFVSDLRPLSARWRRWKKQMSSFLAKFWHRISGKKLALSGGH